jgi:hypothetical protein
VNALTVAVTEAPSAAVVTACPQHEAEQDVLRAAHRPSNANADRAESAGISYQNSGKGCVVIVDKVE